MAIKKIDFSSQQTIETSSGNVHCVQIERDLISNESKRDFEKRVSLAFIHSIFKDDSLQIAYKPTGQPYITSFPFLHISISHSKGWFAIYISAIQPVGIDIQLFQSELERGKSHFVNTSEIKRFNNQLTNTQLYLIWGAKEAVFKLIEGQIIDAKNSFSVYSIDENKSNQIKLKVNNQNTINLTFQVDSEKIIVYTS